MTRQAGYTLLELLVVLVIMGLLIAAIPGIALPGVSSVRFSGEVEDVVSRLSAAREKAIETGRTVLVKPAELSMSGVVIKTQSSSATIIFYPDGSATGDLLVMSYLGRQRIVILDPITGRIRSQ